MAHSPPDTRHATPDTVSSTYSLFRQGVTPDAIARQRGLTERTVWNHLAELVSQGQVNVDQLVPLTVQRQIRDVVGRIGTERLAPIIRTGMKVNSPGNASAPR